ncbi:MAG: hypothetical protein KAU14_09780 [Thermoplasmata archaeon]|nr:hypothetical protein [Thermoplasmata archaeon]
MPKCPYCGNELDYSDIMCPSCGRLVPEEGEEIGERPREKVSRRVSPGKTRHTRRYILAIAIVLFLILPQTAPQRERIQEYPEDPSKILEDVSGLWDWMNPKYYKVAKSATYKIRREFEVRAVGGDIDFRIRIPIPKNVTAEDGTRIQTILDWSYDLPPGVVADPSDPWIYFNGSASEGELVTINVTYSVATRTYEWKDITSKNSGTVDQIPQYLKDKYNHDESYGGGGTPRPLIRLDDVRDVAQEVTSGKNTVYKKVRAIYDFVVDNVVYQVGTRPKTCKETLDGKVGDCDDMVLLFSAMCRAVDIPAFPGYGFVSNRKFEGWGGHSWANAVIPDKNGNVYTPHIDLPNKKFLWCDPYRLIEWNDDGNEDHLTEFYLLHRSEGEGSGDFSQKFVRIAYHTEGETLIKVD